MVYESQDEWDIDDILDEFPFCMTPDEMIKQQINKIKADLNNRVDKRDFQYIEVIGRTLIELETERDIRKAGFH